MPRATGLEQYVARAVFCNAQAGAGRCDLSRSYS